MTCRLLMFAALLGVVADRSDAAPPPASAHTPSVHDLRVGESEAIFTYQVDERCRVTATRMLEGPDDLLWRDVDRGLGISRRDTVWRMEDGRRSQLLERRVRLLGELVLEGELVCHLRPTGQVLEAWIERTDQGAARRRAPTRDEVPVRNGAIAPLGTFSVAYRPDA